jgi:hypothetical protein
MLAIFSYAHFFLQIFRAKFTPKFRRKEILSQKMNLKTTETDKQLRLITPANILIPKHIFSGSRH